ncbi:DNA polymerase III subunit delta [Sphingomonas sp. 28-63-12]|uniref:DNA polymerase III subunit delta n=1 Tax=Sphingomonas sp. 28-63-12 TaxID=1970434 RepID=UPI000BD3A4B3|nr:MAG: DNA polymerase III subunit delta [Sphingomonas sp. 28-63-12]
MKASANQLRQALDSANPAIRFYLLHGPDESGARDLALRLARAMGPDAERIDLDGAMLKGDPGRLAAEAASLSLFGGARHIRVTALGEESHDAITILLAAEQAGNPVVAIAPTLKSSGKVVKLTLAAGNAMSFACYPPEAADADRLAAAIAGEHGLRTSGGTAGRLFAASGGDRAVLTREIEKIALYLDAAPERPTTLDDSAIDAIGADLGEAEMAQAIDAAIAGDAARLGGELARLNEAGVSPIPLMRGLVRRLMTLAELQAEVAAGAAIASVIEGPRVFFKEKAATGRALRHWTPKKLSGAIDHLRQAERAIMSSATAGQVLAEAACLAVARAGRSPR